MVLYKTNYVDIDFTRTPEPLPDDSDWSILGMFWRNVMWEGVMCQEILLLLINNLPDHFFLYSLVSRLPGLHASFLLQLLKRQFTVITCYTLTVIFIQFWSIQPALWKVPRYRGCFEMCISMSVKHTAAKADDGLSLVTFELNSEKPPLWIVYLSLLHV
jgi:hypothetical protein